MSAAPAFSSKPHALPAPPGGPWTVDRALAYTLALAKAEPENDRLAYRFLTPALRPHVANIYAFTRETYALGAEPRGEAERLEALDAWERALIDASRGQATHPVFVALNTTIARFGLPIAPFQDYITGARMNASVKRYKSFQQLLGYCEKAANPIGRVVLRLAGSTEPDDIRAFDDISTAMLLNNFWTHCVRDFSRGRIYIPEEDLRRFGVSESDLKQRRMSKEFRRLMDFEVTRTRLYLKRGRPVFDRLPRALHAELQIVWLGVNVALDNIEASGFDVFSRDHSLRTQDWLRAAGRLAVWRLKDFTQW